MHMGMKTPKHAVISGLFRVGGLRRRLLRSEAAPEIVVQYDRLDRMQQSKPFPPEGLGIRTRLSICWRDLDRLAAARSLRHDRLAVIIAKIDAIESDIELWRAPARMTTGRHGVTG